LTSHFFLSTNELVYEPELVYGFEITHSDGSEDNSDGSFETEKSDSTFD